MVKATFYCRIETNDGDIMETDFDFDSIECNTRKDLDEYIRKSGYELGEPCAFWGDNIGILTEIFVDEV